MTKEDLIKYAEQEVSWLHYYGHRETRKIDAYDDAEFYERLVSIGYAKRNTPLDLRCAAAYITSQKPVLESSLEELESVSGPRNHKNNTYTPLEYVFAKNFEGSEELRDKLRD